MDTLIAIADFWRSCDLWPLVLIIFFFCISAVEREYLHSDSSAFWGILGIISMVIWVFGWFVIWFGWWFIGIIILTISLLSRICYVGCTKERARFSKKPKQSFK